MNSFYKTKWTLICLVILLLFPNNAMARGGGPGFELMLAGIVIIFSLVGAGIKTPIFLFIARGKLKALSYFIINSTLVFFAIALVSLFNYHIRFLGKYEVGVYGDSAMKATLIVYVVISVVVNVWCLRYGRSAQRSLYSDVLLGFLLTLASPILLWWPR